MLYPLHLACFLTDTLENLNKVLNVPLVISGGDNVRSTRKCFFQHYLKTLFFILLTITYKPLLACKYQSEITLAIFHWQNAGAGGSSRFGPVRNGLTKEKGLGWKIGNVCE